MELLQLLQAIRLPSARRAPATRSTLQIVHYLLMDGSSKIHASDEYLTPTSASAARQGFCFRYSLRGCQPRAAELGARSTPEPLCPRSWGSHGDTGLREGKVPMYPLCQAPLLHHHLGLSPAELSCSPCVSSCEPLARWTPGLVTSPINHLCPSQPHDAHPQQLHKFLPCFCHPDPFLCFLIHRSPWAPPPVDEPRWMQQPQPGPGCHRATSPAAALGWDISRAGACVPLSVCPPARRAAAAAPGHAKDHGI